jgi:hypothetical protein
MSGEKIQASDGHRRLDQRASPQTGRTPQPEPQPEKPAPESASPGPDVHGEVIHGEEWEREDGW